MKLKHSRQRESIKEFLALRKDHPTADVVYLNVRKSFPNISLGTVYRNLTLLSELGEINRLRLGDGVDRFDADLTPHYHLVCSECGSVNDLEMKHLDYIDQIAASHFDGQVQGHVAYFYGLCGKCARKHKNIS